MKKMDFLLEIDVEELPVRYVRPILEAIKTGLLTAFKDMRISHGKITTSGTAKRLVCVVEGLSLEQDEAYKEIVGPSKESAFDKDNRPTQQAIGFARSQGVDVKDLKVKKTSRGENVFVRKKLEVRKTKDILKEVLPNIIKNIHCEKTMRWDNSGVTFARPIESISVLFGSENIEIKLGDVAYKRIRGSVRSYLEELTRSCLIDPDIRKEKIRAMIFKSIDKLGGDRLVDEALLEEVTFMVTKPYVFTGSFDKKFLDLPEDVLKASMSKYQRVFFVSKQGRLLNNFIAVIEGNNRDIDAIRKNYERILEARLKDALFFFEEDTRAPLSEGIGKLKYLIFQKDLGNMFEKIQRLKALCSWVCDSLSIDNKLKDAIQRAAELSKADLVTHMVGEFPSLEGIMGKEYALRRGESEIVARAIAEHYLPRSIDDNPPESLAGSVVSLCDKIDSVVGFIGIGIEISGSFDPFGIRRNTQGLIRVIRSSLFRIDVIELADKAIELYGNRLKLDPSALKNIFTQYLKERIEFLSGKDIPGELKEAVLASGFRDIVDAFNRLEALYSIRNERYFLEAAKVVERTANILKPSKEKIDLVNENLLKEQLEKDVWKAYLESRDKIEKLIEEERYKEATKEYAKTFYKVLHEFFDKVLVNVEDQELRRNRLSMMKAINSLYTKDVADLARLPQIVVE